MLRRGAGSDSHPVRVCAHKTPKNLPGGHPNLSQDLPSGCRVLVSTADAGRNSILAEEAVPNPSPPSLSETLGGCKVNGSHGTFIEISKALTTPHMIGDRHFDVCSEGPRCPPASDPGLCRSWPLGSISRRCDNTVESVFGPLRQAPYSGFAPFQHARLPGAPEVLPRGSPIHSTP